MAAVRAPTRVWRSPHAWLLPVVSTTLFYATAYFACWLGLGAQIHWQRVPYDYGMNLLLGMLLFSLSRRLWPFLAIQALLFGIFYAGSALKLAMFGRPLLPEDIHSMMAVVHVLGPAGWLFVALPFALLAGLFVYNLEFVSKVGRIGAALFVAVPLVGLTRGEAVLEGMDGFFGNTPWDQRENFVWRGGTVHFVQELLRTRTRYQPPPDAEAVEAALARRALQPSTRPFAELAGRRRNLHVVLEESFWDPAPLVAAELRESPLDPRFRALWREAGNPHALSPAFGGQTANAEFEVLCGFPVDDTVVRFESGLEREAPCLPRILRAAGFRTVASHPNKPQFWNRTNAYQRLGFETFWSREQFDLDDRNGDPLSDRSLHAQVARMLAETDDGRPVFDYIVTFDGHWPFDAGPRRPQRIRTRSSTPEVEAYANTLYYKSREMMDAIEYWRREDPESLIVVFGDHLPILGWNPGGFVESGVLAPSDAGYTPDMYRTSVATPMLVIDGRNGILKTGDLPLYQLGRLVMQLAGVQGPSLFDLAPAPSGPALRPLTGVIAAFEADGAVRLCRQGSTNAPCQPLHGWLADSRLIARDVFAGQQFALRALVASRGKEPQVSGSAD